MDVLIAFVRSLLTVAGLVKKRMDGWVKKDYHNKRIYFFVKINSYAINK